MDVIMLHSLHGRDLLGAYRFFLSGHYIYVLKWPLMMEIDTIKNPL